MRWKRSGRAEFRPCRSDRADVSRLCCLVRLAPFLFFADVPLFLFTREYAKLSRKQRPRRLQTQRAKEVFTFDRVLSLLTLLTYSPYSSLSHARRAVYVSFAPAPCVVSVFVENSVPRSSWRASTFRQCRSGPAAWDVHLDRRQRHSERSVQL